MNRKTMQAIQRLSIVVAAGAMAFFAGPQAQAFFPFGGSPSDQFQLRFIRWQFEDFDRNGDGDVAGPEDGIDITYEGGPFGWTDEEMLILDESFAVWQNVPTAFAAFRFTLPIEDPAFFGTFDTAVQLDGINLIAIQTEDDPIMDPNVAAPGVLGIALIEFLIDDTFLTSPDGLTTIPVSGGRIIECDIVINGAAHRSAEEGLEPDVELLGTMVHEIGHLLGLGHNPMNNVEVVGDPEAPSLIESPAIAMRDANGVLIPVGVTPTMFPFSFEVDDGTGTLRDGGNDLAVDDVAGITFSYRRGSGNRDFFSISQEARSQVRPGFPSQALLGGLVTAWVDGDNNPSTSRVPLVSTLTGLYIFPTEVLRRGEFDLLGLPKLLETPGLSTPFDATYTLTIEPLNGLRVPFQGPDAFDSTHVLPGDPGWTNVDYDTVFPSEVFHRDGGFFGRNNFDAGTSVMWDEQRREVVLASTGEPLESILPSGRPMFGDQSDVCPLLIIEQAAGVTLGPSVIRRFRDDWMLPTALGAAAAELYYQAGPAMATVVAQHGWLKSALVAAAQGVEWGLHHPGSAATLLLIAGLSVFAAVRARRRRAIVALLIVCAGVASLLAAEPAHALLRYMSDAEKAEVSDAIVHGRVAIVESREAVEGQVSLVLTDTLIEVDEGMKGDLNGDTSFSLSIPGGHAGTTLTVVNELPRFKEGEEVILYLYFVEGHGYVVTGGIQGKVLVRTNPETGEKYVQNSSFPQHKKQAADKQSGESEGDVASSAVSLAEYKAAIKETVKRQKARR